MKLQVVPNIGLVSGFTDVAVYTKTPTVGTGNAYGAAVVIDDKCALLPIMGYVSFGGTFGSETVTAKITAYFGDNTTNYLEVSATSTGNVNIGAADLMKLIKDGFLPYKLVIQAKTSASSTTVTVTVRLACIK